MTAGSRSVGQLAVHLMVGDLFFVRFGPRGDVCTTSRAEGACRFSEEYRLQRVEQKLRAKGYSPRRVLVARVFNLVGEAVR